MSLRAQFRQWQTLPRVAFAKRLVGWLLVTNFGGRSVKLFQVVKEYASLTWTIDCKAGEGEKILPFTSCTTQCAAGYTQSIKFLTLGRLRKIEGRIRSVFSFFFP